MSAPSYIKSLLRPNGQKPSGRKVWSIDLETIWLPFFTATDTDGLTVIPHEALGAPLRLGYNADGSVKFSERTGKPVIKVAKDLSDQIKLVRENFAAGLQQYVTTVRSKNGDAYNEQARQNVEAGMPIVERDKQALQSAIEQAMAEAMAERQAEAQRQPEAQREPEPVNA